jgi:hypothetical protein
MLGGQNPSNGLLKKDRLRLHLRPIQALCVGGVSTPCLIGLAFICLLNMMNVLIDLVRSVIFAHGRVQEPMLSIWVLLALERFNLFWL